MHQHPGEIARPGGSVRVVVGRDHAAQGHAAVVVHPRDDGVHDVAADVLEVDVDPVRAEPVQGRADVLALVVDGPVEPEFAGQPVALGLAAGDADHAGALQLGDLADDRADRTGGGGDDDGLARLRLADLAEAEPGRKARAAQNAHVGGQRHARELSGGEQHRVVRDDVRSPAAHAGVDHIALLEPVGAGAFHHGQRSAAHGVADLDRRHVLVLIAHPYPVGGVEREVECPHQDLAVRQVADRLLDQLQVPGSDFADRAAAQNPALQGGHRLSSPPGRRTVARSGHCVRRGRGLQPSPYQRSLACEPLSAPGGRRAAR